MRPSTTNGEANEQAREKARHGEALVPRSKNQRGDLRPYPVAAIRIGICDFHGTTGSASRSAQGVATNGVTDVYIKVGYRSRRGQYLDDLLRAAKRDAMGEPIADVLLFHVGRNSL